MIFDEKSSSIISFFISMVMGPLDTPHFSFLALLDTTCIGAAMYSSYQNPKTEQSYDHSMLKKCYCLMIFNEESSGFISSSYRWFIFGSLGHYMYWSGHVCSCSTKCLSQATWIQKQNWATSILQFLINFWKFDPFLDLLRSIQGHLFF